MLVTLVAVNSEELLEAYLILIYRGYERRLIATSLNKGALLGVNLCTMLLIECYLDGLNNRTQCLDWFRLNLCGKQRNELCLAQARDIISHGGSLLLFACSLTHVETRLIGSKRRLLICEGLAHICLNRSILNIGSHLRIFGNSADRPLRSRKVDFFGSHRSLGVKLISNVRAAHIVRAKITNLFQRKKHLTLFIRHRTPTVNVTMCNIDHILHHRSHKHKTI